MEEIWKPIPGYEDRYEASNLGRIRSLKFSYVTKNNVKKTSKGRILHPSLKEKNKFNSYERVNLYGKSWYVHDLILFSFIGPRPEKGVCLHFDGNKRNNKITNLRWGTQKENLLDRYRHNTHVDGEKHWHAKLTNDQVKEIRFLLNIGLRVKHIAEIFDIEKTLISTIKHNRSYKKEIIGEFTDIKEYLIQKYGKYTEKKSGKLYPINTSCRDVLNYCLGLINVKQ